MSDDPEGCFTVLWTIENFSHCLSRNAVCLRGPIFETEIANERICWMLFMSKTDSTFSDFRFSLTRVRGSHFPVKYEWSSLPFFNEGTQDTSKSSAFSICEKELFNKYMQSNHILDTLNVRCRIRHKCLKNGECQKRTAMYRVNYTWNIMDYKRFVISEKNILYQQDPLSVTMTLFIRTGKRTDKVMVNALSNKDGQPVFASCNITFPNHGGWVIHNNDPSRYVATIWDIRVFEEKLGISGLNIHLESLIAIEKDLHKNFPLSSRRNCLNTQPSVIVEKKSVPKAVAASTGSLGEDLLLTYRNGSLSDATLNTNSPSFSVHKNILSSTSRSQSSVIVEKKSVPKKAAVSSGLLGEDLLLTYRNGSLSDATLKTNSQSFSVHKNILSSTSRSQPSVIVEKKGVPKVAPVSSRSLGEDLLLTYKGGTMNDAILNTKGQSFSVHKNIRSSRSRPQPSVIVEKKGVPKVVAVSTGSLGEDLMLMYKGGTMSDAILNTNDQSFSVHKNILSSRSSVFRAMFEDDRLSESRSGIVNIDDLDSATVDRLLVYLYSDSLADMQWKDASALYYAADKYDIQPLKTECAEVLRAGVAVSNACEALELADKHADKELMRCVVDFIRDHDEVISSAKWDKLEERNSRLTSKVMRELYLKRARR